MELYKKITDILFYVMRATILRHSLILFGVYLGALTATAQQNSDEAYRRSLKEVLDTVQARFNVTIKYTDSLVANKWVSYADWRFRSGFEETVDNILKPLDLKLKKDKERVYKLSVYEYYRWTPEEGWAELDRLATAYHDKTSWEVRKAVLRPCLMDALQLNPLPASTGSKPIITAERKYKDYSVQNIALEIFPGVYVSGSLYRPLRYKGKIPVILNPDGHWTKQRYRADCQYRCAMLARMGAMTFSYDLFAWGESLLQFNIEDHRKSLSMTMQVLATLRIMDYLLARPDADTNRVAMTGGSGAGSHTVLLAAIDDRIKASVPVVSLSSYFYGGCPCESGMPVHACGGRTNNVEIAAMTAPRPQLVVSDGHDWTDHMPEHDFPYLKKMYGYYGATDKIENVHLPEEGHDFGINKRKAVYDFMQRQLGLKAFSRLANGQPDESGVVIEDEKLLYVFGDNGERLPANAIHGFAELEKRWKGR